MNRILPVPLLLFAGVVVLLPLAAGQPLKVFSERLAHAKTSITLDTYARILPGMQEGAVDGPGAILFGSKTA